MSIFKKISLEQNLLPVDGLVLHKVHSFRSFQEICATRRTCKAWAKANFKVKDCVFFVEDGSQFDVPNRDNPEFRKCLLSMTLLHVHCEISTQAQLEFCCKMVSNANYLHLEVGGDGWNSYYCQKDTIQWDDSSLSTFAPRARHIEVQFFSIPDQKVQIDFNALPSLESFKSNARVLVTNYDNRRMELFACPIDYWSVDVTNIALNTKTIMLTKDFSPAPEFHGFWSTWTPYETHRLMFCSSGLEPFMELVQSEGILMLWLYNTLGLGDEFEFETAEYQIALRHVLNRFPYVLLQFYTDDQSVKEKWKFTATPVYEEFALKYPL